MQLRFRKIELWLYLCGTRGTLPSFLLSCVPVLFSLLALSCHPHPEEVIARETKVNTLKIDLDDVT